MIALKLTELIVGQRGRVTWVDAKKINPQILEIGLVENTEFEVISKTGNFIEVEFYNTKFAIHRNDADCIIVVRS